jgi:hypothetical protein
MRILKNILFSISLLSLAIIPNGCGDEDSPTTSLPQGCQSQGVYALQVLQPDLRCEATNLFVDQSKLLGAPDASSAGPGRTQFTGFTSLGINGSVVVFMGSCIQDLPGPDIRVYQSVSQEAVEVQAAQSENGPFVSLGFKDCGNPAPTYSDICEFDLAGSGLNNVRVLKVIDRETTTFPLAACDNAGMSPGADIDAIEVLHPGN